ncbi:ankyrin repeat-containing domain protein [Vararia minispora EC-137]|uniref:Ankyrin repeat-containing domain protein n=1 Tax=Vararia minispora EC-137 TaxID=1314806 RepID=A0ACB8QHK2_9AGAM|nr:ankyrin repeat-containing domain protein [Vararia minispora EC-137]
MFELLTFFLSTSPMSTPKITELHLVAHYTRPDIMHLILKYGANVHAWEGDNGSALVASKVHTEVARLLLERSTDVSHRDDDGYAALHCVAQEGYVHLARALLEHQLDVINTSDKRGQTALHVTADYGRVKLGRVLFYHNADADIHDEDGAAALDITQREGYTDIVHLLLGHEEIAEKSEGVPSCNLRERVDTAWTSFTVPYGVTLWATWLI